MAIVGDYVKITENYKGNIRDVIGKVGKVVARKADLYALDLRGYKKDQDHTYWDYNVIVQAGEFEVQKPEFKDSKGQLVEIGDTIVYGPLGGGVRIGKVVEIKETEHSSWGHKYKTTKVRVEIDSENYWGDGDRSIRLPSKTFRWYGDSSRMLVIRKGSLDYINALGSITYNDNA